MERALKVTADSAAYYDRSLEETSESLKSFLKGNYENDAALGLSCTETTRNAAANKLYGKSFKDLSESQKQLTLLQMVEEANELSGALGQASREGTGWENVTGNMKAAWEKLQAVIGTPIMEALIPVIENITLTAKWTDTMIKDGVTYYYRGVYPQTRVTDEKTIEALTKKTITDSRGYYELNGSYYAKVKFEDSSDKMYFNDGTRATVGNTYYFKVEKILWKVIDKKAGLVISDKVLDALPFYDNEQDRNYED